MLTIGCHLSTSKGFLAMGETALSIGANTFAFFTRNPRGGKAKAIDPADAAALRALMAEHNFGPLVAHAPYTLNPCSDKPHAREFALECMADDLVRMESVPGNYYNFHPGSHVKQGAEAGIELMKTGRYSVTQIAMRLGYDTLQSFSKAFRRVMDIPPTEYLRRLRTEGDANKSSGGETRSD